jgi:hypothetical protein
MLSDSQSYDVYNIKVWMPYVVRSVAIYTVDLSAEAILH